MTQHNRTRTRATTALPRRSPRGALVVRDWAPLLHAISDVIDWALDIGVALSRDTPDDVDAIEGVRDCFHAWLDGEPCDMELSDLLLTFGTILAAIQLELGIDSAEVIHPPRPGVPRRFTPTLHCPGVERPHRTSVVIRKCPGARISRASHSHTA